MKMKQFKVGDKVWSFQKGESVIERINKDEAYSISAGYRMFTIDGKYISDDRYATLYHLDDAKRLFPQFFEEEEPEPEPQKKKKLLAPAVIKSGRNRVLARVLCASVEDAKCVHEESFLYWPAIPNEQGYYEVEE